jgi:hypothetical protein
MRDRKEFCAPGYKTHAMDADVVALLQSMQRLYVAQHEYRDNWSDMLFSASFLAPILQIMRDQMKRAFIFARPGERLEPVDAQAAYDIVFRLVAAGPKYLGIKTRDQAHVRVVRALLKEYVYPWRYARKNAFGGGRREVMVRPPPGVFQRRNQELARGEWQPVAACNSSRAAIIQQQKARLRALGY